MKERTIKIIVLSVVFVAAMIGFSFWTNRGGADMTAAMEEATLPTISVLMGEKKINPLVGHRQEMNVSAVRDTIAVCDEKEELTVKISHNEEDYTSLKYEVYTLDGKELLYEGSAKKIKGEVTLSIKQGLVRDEERLLKLTLQKEGKNLYYYTRIVKDNQYHLKECLEYIEELHTNMLKKENEDAVKKVMEASTSGDTTTLQHVTIHSELKRSMWGDLKPELVGSVKTEVKETKAAYTSVLLQYQVKCKGDNNEEERYKVNEFFKVSYGTERIYLLEYDRTMEEIFSTTNIVLSSKGIILGMSDKSLEYRVNEEGNIVAFVQADALWNYQKDEDLFSLIFSFSDSEKTDERHDTDEHFIKLLSMEHDGSMTFSVCGYMNRGKHEGESGIAIYYYDISKNIVEEEAFIPSTESAAVIDKELHQLAFYNKEQDVLYVLLEGKLLKVTCKDKKQTILIEGLEKGQYVTSKDGHLLAYQRVEDGKTEIWNFLKDSKNVVPTEEKETVVPLGFVGSDFVYGISKAEDIGTNALGDELRGMCRMEIRNESNKVVKTYEKTGVYILEATISNNQILIRQGIKNGNVYQETTEDYITNNETTSSELVKLDSYRTDLKETQYRFVFTKGIKNKNAKTVRTKQVILESPMVLELEKKTESAYYYVYGLGGQKGAFENGGDAISLADELSGVVISPGQHYAWEDGNRVSWYRNFEINRFTPNVGETSLVACVRTVLKYEGKNTDVSAEVNASNIENVMEKQLQTEVMRFRGCSAKSMCYLIDKGVPVIAMKDASRAILLIGYDAKTVTYVEPESGSIFTSAFEKVDEMLSGSGRTFIAYAK